MILLKLQLLYPLQIPTFLQHTKHVMARISPSCPKCCSHFLVPTSRLYFSPVPKYWPSTTFPSKAVLVSSACSVWLCPPFPAAALCLWQLYARTLVRGQSRHFGGHCRISASSGWCGCAPYNHPDVSNQLGSTDSPHPLSALREREEPSETGQGCIRVNID